jgi:hypothetical protein
MRSAAASNADITTPTPGQSGSREKHVGALFYRQIRATLQADPGDLGAQSNLIGPPEPISTDAVLAVPNGGSRARVADQSGHRA